MAPFIENISKRDFEFGLHYDAGPNSMLIQILDPCGWFPVSKIKFKEIHQFEFLDLEDHHAAPDEQCRISDEQAAKLADLLQHALANQMNVIVHCQAGICRSGAVVDVAVQLGFRDPEKFRSPNLAVKHKMMKHLGLMYDPFAKHTEYFTDNERKL